MTTRETLKVICALGFSIKYSNPNGADNQDASLASAIAQHEAESKGAGRMYAPILLRLRLRCTKCVMGRVGWQPTQPRCTCSTGQAALATRSDRGRREPLEAHSAAESAAVNPCAFAARARGRAAHPVPILWSTQEPHGMATRLWTPQPIGTKHIALSGHLEELAGPPLSAARCGATLLDVRTRFRNIKGVSGPQLAYLEWGRRASAVVEVAFCRPSRRPPKACGHFYFGCHKAWSLQSSWRKMCTSIGR